MFGILFTLFDLVGMARFKIIMESGRMNNRQKAIEKGEDTYYDKRGRMWYVKPDGKDIRCFVLHNIHNKHDQVVRLDNPYIVLKDLTAIEEQKELEKLKKQYKDNRARAKERGSSYFFISYHNGKRYVTVFFKTDTGVCYNTGHVGKDAFFIDIYEFDFETKKKNKISCNRITKEEYNKYGGSWCESRY